ncbi:ComEA family DNA-binding protein [Thiohalorhabdus sp. Cl-TMA]|uniref:ComEA family DNA-binding protein n=1 Tax=Thiohalorhabdus methylotrophus TaxID=3242694 RepID=A0ABV4TX76_9GAMM
MRQHLVALVLAVATCLPTLGHAAEPVNLNQANSEELIALNGIGEVLAERIIAFREDNDGFDSVAQLAEVDGIGAKTLESMRDKVTVGQ